MSENLSLLSKLTNKVTYKVNEAVDDPKANQYAEEQKKQQEEAKKNTPNISVKTPDQLNQEKISKFNSDPKNKEFIEKNVKPSFEKHLIVLYNKLKAQNKSDNDINNEISKEMSRVNKIVDDNILQDKTVEEIFKILEKDFEKTDDPTAKQFSPKRIASNTWDTIKNILSYTLFPILSLFIACLIANESIMYPYQMRIGFFLFTFFLCITIKPIIFIIGLFYLGKWCYQYYNNELTDNPKIQLIPTQYAILPLVTSQPKSAFWSFLLTPFIYGAVKSTQDKNEINQIMKNYDENLQNSFPFIDQLKNKPPYQKRLEKITQNFKELHKSVAPSNSSVTTNSSITTNSSVTPNSSVTTPTSTPIVAKVKPEQTKNAKTNTEPTTNANVEKAGTVAIITSTPTVAKEKIETGEAGEVATVPTAPIGVAGEAVTTPTAPIGVAGEAGIAGEAGTVATVETVGKKGM